MSKLITQEYAGTSLVICKKTLDKNNSHIKLVLKGLVSQGTLVQNKGTNTWAPSNSARRLLMNSLGQGQEVHFCQDQKAGLVQGVQSPKRTKTNKRAQKPRTSAVLNTAQGDMKAAGAKASPAEEAWQGQDRKAHSWEIQVGPAEDQSQEGST